MTELQSVEFYQHNPVNWMEDFLESRYWYKQEEIINSVAANDLTTAKSGHGVGKSYSCGGLGLWFLFNFPPPNLLITSAPTMRQVKAILWAEMRAMHSKLGTKMVPESLGEMLQTELRFGPRHYGMGMSTDDPDAFQGLHAEHMLVIFDEACGIPREIYEAAESLMSAKGNKVLLIGNPTEPNTYFHWTFTGKIPGYHRITVSSTESPNIREREDGLYEDIEPVPFPGLVSARWINQKILTYGRHSNYCKARVFGEFPTTAEDQLIDGKHVALAIMKGAQLRGLINTMKDLKEIINTQQLDLIR